MACVFNKQLLHPRNWLTWFGLGILWLIVQLPYPLLHFIGTSAGRLSRRFLKRREHIARRNIELCFPDMSPAARETLIDQKLYVAGNGAYRNRHGLVLERRAGQKNGLMSRGSPTLITRLAVGKG
ncbi:Lipid A biosynthesis lauroyl acyltransferase [Klebsiella pneumoniae IS43]|uniref:Lipid A biosynthesis lauroyl acyltransferase n=1 Tax=Klebsiella pneumoniae IS43 TaxID=1432552 RepID=W1DHB9_KLEPN|nr:Lipid A biosynthesis lauroyl acyltransferase [Klebsiella pneumoniae IS43]